MSFEDEGYKGYPSIHHYMLATAAQSGRPEHFNDTYRKVQQATGLGEYLPNNARDAQDALDWFHRSGGGSIMQSGSGYGDPYGSGYGNGLPQPGDRFGIPPGYGGGGGRGRLRGPY